MIAGRRYEGAVWHQYFNCPGKKEPMLSDVFEKKIRFYKLNYPFLQKKQIMAKVYEELKIPHYCGNPDKYVLFCFTRLINIFIKQICFCPFVVVHTLWINKTHLVTLRIV